MSEELELIKLDTESLMKKAINHLETELIKIRAGKANPNMLDGIVADYYGAPTPLAQIANISVLDARTISVQPWEKKMLQPIERAIIASNIGINPQNDGNFIRLYLPPLTEERRKELVKKCNAEGRIMISWNQSHCGEHLSIQMKLTKKKKNGLNIKNFNQIKSRQTLNKF